MVNCPCCSSRSDRRFPRRSPLFRRGTHAAGPVALRHLRDDRWTRCVHVQITRAYVSRRSESVNAWALRGKQPVNLTVKDPGSEQIHVLPTPSARLGQLQEQWSAFVLVRVTRHSTYSKQTIKPQESNTSGTRTGPRPRAASRARAPPAPATRRLGARRPRRRGPRP